jgi:hypothetical protein
MNKLLIVTLGISGGRVRSRGVFATSADSPRHDGTLYRGLHVRRECLGFVHHSNIIFCRPVPNPTVTIRNCFDRCSTYEADVCHVIAADLPFDVVSLVELKIRAAGLLGQRAREHDGERHPAVAKMSGFAANC